MTKTKVPLGFRRVPYEQWETLSRDEKEQMKLSFIPDYPEIKSSFVHSPTEIIFYEYIGADPGNKTYSFSILGQSVEYTLQQILLFLIKTKLEQESYNNVAVYEALKHYKIVSLRVANKNIATNENESTSIASIQYYISENKVTLTGYGQNPDGTFFYPVCELTKADGEVVGEYTIRSGSGSGGGSGALKSGQTEFNFEPEPGQNAQLRFVYQYFGDVDPGTLTYTDPTFDANMPLPFLSYYLMMATEYSEGEEIELPFSAIKDFINCGFYSVILDVLTTSTDSEDYTFQMLFNDINTDKRTHLSGTVVVGEKTTVNFALDMDAEKITFAGASGGGGSQGVIKEGKIEMLQPDIGVMVEMGVYQYTGDVDPGSIMFDIDIFGGLTPLPLLFIAPLSSYNYYANSELFDALFNSNLINVYLNLNVMGMGQGYINNINVAGDYIRYHFAVGDDYEVIRAYHRISPTEMEEVYDFNLANRLNQMQSQIDSLIAQLNN